MNRRESIRNTRHKNTNDPQKKYRLGTVSKNISLEGLNRFHGPTSSLVQIFFITNPKLSLFKNSLSYSGTVIWNSIPLEFVQFKINFAQYHMFGLDEMWSHTDLFVNISTPPPLD